MVGCGFRGRGQAARVEQGFLRAPEHAEPLDGSLCYQVSNDVCI